MQAATVSINLRQARWRCKDLTCPRSTFVDHVRDVAPPFARRTARVAKLALLLAHAAGGRPAERLMTRLGLPQSDDTLLRALKRHGSARSEVPAVRVVGIDDWSWRKGTIMVDLERRQVVDVLADRSSETTARWLAGRPEIAIVSRDRCGLYAHGAAKGAPQARQVADRFHLIQNLRQSIERQLSRSPRQQALALPLNTSVEAIAAPGTVICRYGQPAVTEDRDLRRNGRRAASQRLFTQVKVLQNSGKSHGEIVTQTRLHWRTVEKWLFADALPERAAMAHKSTTPTAFRSHLAQRWADGCTLGRELLPEIKALGYTGSMTHLQRFLNQWRRAHFAAEIGEPALKAAVIMANIQPHAIAPIAAASLCIKPRGALTPGQTESVERLKAECSDFAEMRRLAMRFRGLMRGKDASKLDAWVLDAGGSGIHGIRRFAATLRQDATAVRNAICERWSNGQTEGQINRLKTLKRAMYGRAGIELLRARMLPLQPATNRD